MIPYPPPLFASSLTSAHVTPLSPQSPSSSIVTGSEGSSPSTPSPPASKVKKDRECQCEICGKTFGRHWLLQGHLRTHNEKPHHCSRCGKRFALKSYLSKHEESACYRSSSSAISAEKPTRSSLSASSLL
ncbi:zinc finger, C2H2 type [Necator americanus]|uniref:Zinc finger, C2H2 type n=1 Tax=Necator americanus TaxID=51031 RepID=W2TWU7_NECAM|nr:zinc finger, C2H2 type [Necator americanus]ETN85546.1 zinc finger, C2H2 type [Necator americanus]